MASTDQNTNTSERTGRRTGQRAGRRMWWHGAAAGVVAAAALSGTAAGQCSVSLAEILSQVDFRFGDGDIEQWAGAAVDGDRAYLLQQVGAEGTISGFPTIFFTPNLFTFDVSDPADPVLLSRREMELPTSFDPVEFDIEVVGDTLILDESTLSFFDIAGTGPVPLRGTYRPDIGAVSEARTGSGLVYVTLTDSGTRFVAVLDASDPADPRELGRVALPFNNFAEGRPANGLIPLTVVNAPNDIAVRVIDARDPANPVLGGEADLGSATVVAREEPVIIGDRLLARSAGPAGGLLSIDISDPMNPVLVGEVLPGIDFEDFAAAGRYLYTVRSVSFRAYDFADPNNPLQIASVSLLTPGQERIFLGSGFALTGRGFGDFPRRFEILDLGGCTPLPFFSASPESKFVMDGEQQDFSVVANETNQFRWLLNGVPLEDGAGVSGSATDTLTLVGSRETEGVLTCVAANDFDSIVSSPAVFAVREDAFASLDYNGDGSFDFLDALGFLTDLAVVADD